MVLELEGVEEECSACRMEPIPNLRDNGFIDSRDTDPGRQVGKV